MSLRAANLNLLPILRALLKEANVSRASAKIGLSQPAMSSALNRLRAQFEDPLLVQVGRAMQLTPRALELLPKVERLCTDMELLLQETEFIPANTERSFAIATPDYMALLIGPALIDALNAIAPKVSVRFVDVQSDLNTRLAAGNYDLAVIAWVEELLLGLNTQRGWADRLVGVVAADHPFAQRPPTSYDELMSQPHISIDVDAMQIARARTPFPLLTHRPGPLRLSASHLLIQPLLALRTQCVTIVPKALADYIAVMMPVKIFELPEQPLTIDLTTAWGPIYDTDPAHRWFREILHDILHRHFG